MPSGKIPVALLLVPVVSTLAGGLLAVHFRRFRYGLLAAGAGLLLGAAFLDLLPEAIGLGAAAHIPAATPLGVALLSFLAFFMLDSVLAGMSTGISAAGAASGGSLGSMTPASMAPRSMGRVGAALLIFHSFRDGMAIGAAFAASHSAGYAVAVGIVAHDFGDGMNTMILTTGGKRARWPDVAFLVADAVAPLLGGLVALRWFTSARSSVTLLAIAAGFFLQMAGSDFLPEIRRSAARPMQILPYLAAGVGLIYAANLLLSRFA